MRVMATASVEEGRELGCRGYFVVEHFMRVGFFWVMSSVGCCSTTGDKKWLGTRPCSRLTNLGI